MKKIKYSIIILFSLSLSFAKASEIDAKEEIRQVIYWHNHAIINYNEMISTHYKYIQALDNNLNPLINNKDDKNPIFKPSIAILNDFRKIIKYNIESLNSFHEQKSELDVYAENIKSQLGSCIVCLKSDYKDLIQYIDDADLFIVDFRHQLVNYSELINDRIKAFITAVNSFNKLTYYIFQKEFNDQIGKIGYNIYNNTLFYYGEPITADFDLSQPNDCKLVRAKISIPELELLTDEIIHEKGLSVNAYLKCNKNKVLLMENGSLFEISQTMTENINSNTNSKSNSNFNISQHDNNYIINELSTDNFVIINKNTISSMIKFLNDKNYSKKKYTQYKLSYYAFNSLAYLMDLMDTLIESINKRELVSQSDNFKSLNANIHQVLLNPHQTMINKTNPCTSCNVFQSEALEEAITLETNFNSK